MEVKPLPAVPYIKIPDEGEPYLEGYKCGSCGATFLGERTTCSKCGARDQMSTTTLPTKGKLYSYSIVYRSFPGIDVPYISAIVDLEDGTAIKGNLINIDPALLKNHDISKAFECHHELNDGRHSFASVCRIGLSLSPVNG